MPRTRVLQVVSGVAIGDQSGGAELFGAQLASHLPSVSFESAVFAMWQYGSAAELDWLRRLSEKGIPVYGLVCPSGSLAGDLARAFPRFWSTVSGFRPAIINSHTERGDVFAALAAMLHPVRPRVVRTKHTDQPWSNLPWVGSALAHALYPLAFSAEVGVSLATCEVLDRRPLTRWRRKRSVLCYNGIDAGIFDRQGAGRDTPPPGIPKAKPLIGVVGRLVTQKGHADLLRALRILRQTHPAHLLIVGAGPLEAELRAIARDLDLADCAHFLGTRPDVLEILSHLDALVSSSLWEGFATVLLEAMALGVPVVATDVSGSRELIQPGATGVLVPPGQPRDLARGLTAVLDDPGEARRRAAAARQGAARFTIQGAAAQYSRMYRSLEARSG